VTVYRWVDHTAELELHIDAPAPEDVFADALAALGELLDDEGQGAYVVCEVGAVAADRPALLATWMDELLYLAEREQLIPRGLERLELGPGRVRATVRARPGAPAPRVKGVTYHNLAFGDGGGACHATVVLDV
jgi:SHS2 domain-containing protein